VQRRRSTVATSRTEGSDDEAELKAIVDAIEAYEAKRYEASVEGAYYGNLMEAAEAQGRIGNFPAVEDVPVHTGWDIGHHDYTSIWFWQRLVGRLRIVGYFQDSGEGMPYYATEVKKLYGGSATIRRSGPMTIL
jgi:hypothetical protein